MNVVMSDDDEMMRLLFNTLMMNNVIIFLINIIKDCCCDDEDNNKMMKSCVKKTKDGRMDMYYVWARTFFLSTRRRAHACLQNGIVYPTALGAATG